MQIEGDSFRSSILYWLRILEERANQEFVVAMGGGKAVVARWRTLSVLAELSGITVTELSAHTQIERTALSHLLTQLEKEELLKRVPRKDDRRILEVHLLPSGRDLFEKMLPVRRRVFRQAADGLAPDELELMMATTRHLVENLERSSDDRQSRRVREPADAKG